MFATEFLLHYTIISPCFSILLEAISPELASNRNSLLAENKLVNISSLLKIETDEPQSITIKWMVRSFTFRLYTTQAAYKKENSLSSLESTRRISSRTWNNWVSLGRGFNSWYSLRQCPSLFFEKHFAFGCSSPSLLFLGTP